MTQAQDGNGAREPRPLWRFEPLSRFEPPPTSVSEFARKGLRALLQRFRGEDPECPERAPGDALEAQGPEELEKQVPALPLDAIADALAAAVPEEGEAMARVVLEAPVGGGAGCAERLARTRQMRVVAPPTPEALLDGTSAAVRELERHRDEPLMLPNLERWFLREPRALDALRELLAVLALRRGTTLVSCGSWAWAWLRAAVQVHLLFPEPLALVALDAGDLARWFGSGPGGRLLCREPEGRWLLPPEGTEVEGEGSDFFTHLAAEARGNAGVARALWSDALRQPPPGAFEDVAPGAGGLRLVAVPWSQLERPEFERWPRFEEIAVLHSLVLHGELSTEILARLLPFARSSLASALAQLASARLVEARAERWRVTAAGYPAVRCELIAAGLPADDF